jgi:hypothetical protein
MNKRRHALLRGIPVGNTAIIPIFVSLWVD